jgi:hypothetical protein
MDDLTGSGDRSVDSFVDANLSSFAAWDVAAYLEHSVGVGADIAELTGRLGRKKYEIEPVLRDFVDRGIACVSSEPDGVVRYALSADPEVQRVVSLFVESAKIREVRLDFVRRVLGHMSRVG